MYAPYYVVCYAPNDWRVKFCPTGTHTETVAQFSSETAANAMADKLNKKHSQPV